MTLQQKREWEQVNEDVAMLVDRYGVKEVASAIAKHCNENAETLRHENKLVPSSCWAAMGKIFYKVAGEIFDRRLEPWLLGGGR